ncbi:MAG TPA: septum formation initiator [Rhodopila sp.]|nr:septum formation initiator [Rhodopila sp.]
MSSKRIFVAVLYLFLLAPTVVAHATDSPPKAEPAHLPADVTSHQTLDLPGRVVRFTATAGSVHLTGAHDAPLTDIAFVAYQAEGSDAATRPVTFVFNGGPGMASAWLQMGAIGPWRVPLNPSVQGPSAPAMPVPNADTWLDFTDLVFIDPPGTGYSRILTTDAEAQHRLWSVDGDIDVLAEAVRRWLDQNKRNVSPKYILGESYGGFRGPRLVRALESDNGVGVSGLILLSPLLDVHEESGVVDPMTWVDLLPSEVAITRARKGPVNRADMADVEAYAISDYLTDMLRGGRDHAALNRLTDRVTALTGLDPAVVRRAHGRLDTDMFQQLEQPGQVASVYDGTIMRPNPMPRELASQFPDPILSGLAAPITSAMMAIYTNKLDWHPDTTYHLSSDAAFAAWNWGRGLGRPESLTALEAARSLDPHLRVLIAHGLFDLRTPYFTTVRMLRLLPDLEGAAPVVLRVYPGGHMFYFGDAARAALRNDAKSVFDPGTVTEGSP